MNENWQEAAGVGSDSTEGIRDHMLDPRWNGLGHRSKEHLQRILEGRSISYSELTARAAVAETSH